MAKGRREAPPCCKSYGLPLYCARWAPLHRIISNDDSVAAEEEKPEQETKADPSSPHAASQFVLVLGGGGGEGRSGVPNAILLSQFDVSTRSLSDQPLHRLGTGADVPYRMAVHPGGQGIVCSFPKSTRWFEWELPKSKESCKIALKSSEKTLTQLEDAGMQLALAFDAEGSMLATGGEDGHVRVFKWPNMDSVLDQADVHPTVKDLHFSLDTKFLVSVGNNGPCRVWDLASSTVAASLPRENGEVFSFCRFSQSADSSILYLTSMHGDQGRIVSWNSDSWKRAESKRITRHPISAFSVSASGSHLAVGTIEGDIVIINSDMQVLTTVRKAHVGIITAVEFSQDSRALVSASFDSTARVTLVEDRHSKGLNIWFIGFFILLAFLVYFMKLKEAPQ